ncbi:proline-rich proteoglycan 2-like [Macrosteles quadrilineatus]|uniref:proline-rich proteoglycan 2-like n=1 Tax=Macrosteles quadrilineatus TaxID=74068 RepID=UPI0023E0B0F3|nr:proline-rich proteoglycan 2-like [Macrosteles quadrilineatus]
MFQAPSGGIEGSSWFEQMASTLNQPPKPGFQDPGVKSPFQPQQPNNPVEEPNMGQPPQPGVQQPSPNQGLPPRQYSLFDLLFGPAFSDPDFPPQPRGFQPQNQPTDPKSQPAQGFEVKQPGMESQGFGFQNTGFQTQQAQQPHKADFQQPPNPEFQQPPNPEFQQTNTNQGFQPNQNTGFQGQPGVEGRNPAFNDPMQSEMSLFNNLLRNFFMW